MESDAENSPRGMALSMESLRTLSDADAPAATPKKTPSGVAPSVTAANCTPVRSSPLSADDDKRLLRIWQDRQRGWMVMGSDVDFLLEIVERLSR